MPFLKKKITVQRINETCCTIQNIYNIPVSLFAKKEVPLESEGLEQLSQFLDLQETLTFLWQAQQENRISPFWGEEPGFIEKVVLTPDFHKGSGIPVGTVANINGFVIPAAIGNDICCGMRLLSTDVTASELAPVWKKLESRLRSLYFGGERNIPMSPRQREALLREGLPGLLQTYADNQNQGLWQFYDPKQQESDLQKIHFGGSLQTNDLFSFDGYIQSSGDIHSRDAQIGSVGGGNHFVELQTVLELFDGGTAHCFGLKREAITFMVHSGSVGLGHGVGGVFMDKARALYPKELPHPNHGFYVLPINGPHQKIAHAYLSAMNNAANFAFANRLFLGLLMQRALSEILGRRVQAELIYDAPHNLIWPQDEKANSFLHRKGACPALGPNPEKQGPFSYTGHPVIIPGSMGDASFVLAGEGNESALQSACHGAGRTLTRGASARISEEIYQKTMAPLRVVTPIDPNAPQIKQRRDILEKYHLRLKEEAPYAYKPVSPVVETVEEANIARRVAKLWPLLTVKG